MNQELIPIYLVIFKACSVTERQSLTFVRPKELLTVSAQTIGNYHKPIKIFSLWLWFGLGFIHECFRNDTLTETQSRKPSGIKYRTLTYLTEIGKQNENAENKLSKWARVMPRSADLPRPRVLELHHRVNVSLKGLRQKSIWRFLLLKP